jgi:lactate/malate dehydrogenase, alpha/beta C-terminal domain
VSTLRLHRDSFSGITLPATKGHTFFLNTPWTEHDPREVCFRYHSYHNLFWPEYLTKVGNPKVSCPKNEARQRAASQSVPGVPDGYLVTLIRTTDAVYDTVDHDPAGQRFTSSYMTLRLPRSARPRQRRAFDPRRRFSVFWPRRQEIVNGSIGHRGDLIVVCVPKRIAAAANPERCLVATNPVAVMIQIVTAIAGRGGVASERVIGSGTILDSARFRTLLAAHVGISPMYIDARVLGEHGDSEVLHWSGAAAGNLSVAEVAQQMGRRLQRSPSRDLELSPTEIDALARLGEQNVRDLRHKREIVDVVVAVLTGHAILPCLRRRRMRRRIWRPAVLGATAATERCDPAHEPTRVKRRSRIGTEAVRVGRATQSQGSQAKLARDPCSLRRGALPSPSDGVPRGGGLKGNVASKRRLRGPRDGATCGPNKSDRRR